MKKATACLLAACLLAPGQSVLHNCPDLSDVSVSLDILRLLGCRAEREGDTVVLITHDNSIAVKAISCIRWF